jgi:hypothetical protein
MKFSNTPARIYSMEGSSLAINLLNNVSKKVE